jgi:hypothetical protein
MLRRVVNQCMQCIDNDLNPANIAAKSWDQFLATCCTAFHPKLRKYINCGFYQCSMERKRKLDIFQSAQPGGTCGVEPAAAADGSLNPYTGRSYSSRYFEILAGRQGKKSMNAADAICTGNVSLFYHVVWHLNIPSHALFQDCRFGKPRMTS